jgi:hypothetical protein
MPALLPPRFSCTGPREYRIPVPITDLMINLGKLCAHVRKHQLAAEIGVAAVFKETRFLLEDEPQEG